MSKNFFLQAPAKINLGLCVKGRRHDGYHELETVMQQISLSDVLLFSSRPGRGWSFSCSDKLLAGPDNLVCKAAKLLADEVSHPLEGVHLTLFKRIPVQAGLGGGSSDAAAALVGLNHYWQLGLSRERLLFLGEQLGSDVPFFLVGGTVLARGRGEVLRSLSAIPFYWVILALVPGDIASTAEVYGSLSPGEYGNPSLETLLRALEAKCRGGLKRWFAREKTNTLATVRLAEAKGSLELAQTLRSQGFSPAQSGSGPTHFLLIEQYGDALTALKAVEELGARAYLCWTMKGSEGMEDV